MNHSDALHRAATSLRRLLRPPVTITDPPAGAVVDWDVAAPMRDGIRLRVNVFRPATGGPWPVLLCAHPYGKDDIPLRHRTRRGRYRATAQYRLMRTAPVIHSAWTSWESPDPGHWVARGYAVVNADLRGWGTSEGEPTVLSAQEADDVHDLIEWAGTQPWSTGRVGMSGVSYLAISQWAGASTRPPHLAAICPWEGFTDLYRNFARPGGVLETGFFTVWSTVTTVRSKGRVDLRGPARRRPLVDPWWIAKNPAVERIDVPALVCGSFSDHNLHSAGSFDGFRRLSSAPAWLYTHRGPKWATYYSDDALEMQTRFFDQFLRDRDTGIVREPPVRLEIREDRTIIARVTTETRWPPAGIRWRALHGRPDGTLGDEPESGVVTFGVRRGRARFCHRFAADTDVVGPMTVVLHLSIDRGDDLSVFAAARKVRDGREVTFEGSYGFLGDGVTHGILLASHREVDERRCRPGGPFHPHTARAPLTPGVPVRLEIGLLPSATRFRAGDELRLDIQGRWFHGRNPITGQFPVGYRRVGKGRCTVYLGSDGGLELQLPVLPAG